MQFRLVLAAAAAFAFAAVPLAGSAIPPAGKPLPDFSLPSLAGRPITLATLKGKATYINLFASWCGPCNDEAPSIGRLRVQYAKQGLQVLGVDEIDADGQGAAFQKKYGNPYTLVAIDNDGVLRRQYGGVAMPVHVFIDRRGIVRTARIGEMTPAEIEAAIKDALK